MVDCKTIVFFFSKSVLENEAPKSRVYKGQTGVEFFGCFVFEIGCRFRDLGASCSSFGCFVFEFWVLRFRSILGASFSRFGCFVLRSSFSSASFSKLPV